MPSKLPLIAIVGPTASGKTHRAVKLAQLIDAEIISGDSRQIYRSMDIGTGKDLEEYEDVNYHLIDIAPAGYKYNLFEYIRDFHHVYYDIMNRGKRTILAGGTGMYIETVLKGVRLPEVPENKELRETLKDKTLEELTEMLSKMKKLHNHTDVDTVKRAVRAIEIEAYYLENPEKAKDALSPSKPIESIIIGVDISREARRKRITERLYQRLEQGMIEEVKALLDSGINQEDLIYYGLEYKYLTLYLTGVLSKEEMVEQLMIAIHQFAKRQMTWFRGMERRGFKINWIPFDLTDNEFNERCLDLIGSL